MAFIKKGFENAKSAVRGGTRTEDKDFKSLLVDLDDCKKGLDRIGGHVAGYASAELQLLQAQKKLGDDMMTNFLEPNTAEGNLVRDNIAMIDKMLLQKQRLDDTMRREFLDPINKYKAQYREIEERIRERKRRLDEMDKLTDDVKKYTKNSDARLNATQKKLDATTVAYEELNAELMEDIPKLIRDKELYFHPLVAVLLDAQFEFYSTMSEQLSALRERTAQIDRKSIHTHPTVITPRNQSCAHKSYSVFGSASAAPAAAAAAAGGSSNPYAAPAAAPMGGAAPSLPGRPGLPPRGPAVVRGRGQWDFTTNVPEELPFRAGDVLTILEQSGDWWKAELNGRVGLIPANYIQLM